MEKNFKITIEYDGTDYHGFQLQPDVKTIQGEVENSLAKIFQGKVTIYGAGRTDAGVHARGQVANFKVCTDKNEVQIHRALNGLLPKDIAVHSVEEVSSDFHSRFSAKSRRYRYTILNRPYRSVFLRPFSFFYRYPLDVDLMNKGAQILRGTHDFTSFRASSKEVKDNVRTILDFTIRRQEDFIITEVEANGFLHNMVRILMGTFIMVGRGKYSLDRVWEILMAKNRRAAGPTLPPRGLCLLNIKY